MTFGNSTMDEYTLSRHFLIGSIIFKCIFIICGVIGNLAVIFYQIFLSKNKTPTNYLVINLAISDLLACVLIYSIGIHKYLNFLHDVNEGHEFYCKFFYSTSTMSVALSTLTLLAISYDRYVFIRWPLRYPLIITWRKVKIFITVIWLVASAAFPTLVVFIRSGDSKMDCTLAYSAAVALNAIYNFIPVCIIFTLHFKIFQIARRHKRRIDAVNVGDGNQGSAPQFSFSPARLKKELKSIKTFAIIIAGLLCCLTPYSVVIFAHTLCQCVSREISFTAGDMVGVNSIINAFIYGIRHKEYKKAFQRWLFGS